MRCPQCGAVVSNSHPPGKPYTCRGCGLDLQLSRAANRKWSIGNGIFGVGLPLLLGLRGWDLVGAALVVFFLAPLILMPVYIKIWPPTLEPYDGRRIWG